MLTVAIQTPVICCLQHQANHRLMSAGGFVPSQDFSPQDGGSTSILAASPLSGMRRRTRQAQLRGGHPKLIRFSGTQFPGEYVEMSKATRSDPFPCSAAGSGRSSDWAYSLECSTPIPSDPPSSCKVQRDRLRSRGLSPTGNEGDSGVQTLLTQQ